MAETLTIRTASSTEVVKISSQGPQGPAGQGVPVGGSTGQVLRKASGSDYDTEWAAAGSGSGSVTSVALASSHLAIIGSPITDSGTITANFSAGTLASLALADSASQPGHTHTGSQVNVGTTSGLPLKTGTAGVIEAGSFGSSAGTFAAGDDARFTDSRNPLAHKASHATGGADALAPSDIGAQSLFTNSSQVVSADVTLAAGRATKWTIENYNGTTYNITLPTSNNQAGDVIVVVTGTLVGSQTIRKLNFGSNYTTLATLSDGQSYRFIATASGGGSWQIDPVYTHEHAASAITSGTLDIARIPTGSTSTTVAPGNHSHELTALSATGATNGHVLTANGSNGVTFAALPASGVTGAASSASDVLGVSGANITGVDANADRIIFWDDSASALKHLTVGSGLSLTDTTLTATGGGVTTGSVDNAILRADGTGGSTSQSSDLVIDDATTSTQANVALRNNHSETNSALVLTPKGTGAFIVGPKPDASASGGNARGIYAIDINTERSNASRIASGARSICIGTATLATQASAIAIGNNAWGDGANSIGIGVSALGGYGGATNNICIGSSTECRANNSICIGNLATLGSTSSTSAVNILGGAISAAVANSFSLGSAASLRAQVATLPFSAVYWGGQTTDATANVELNLDATATNRFTIAANTALIADILLIANSTGAGKALSARRAVAIRRDGSNNTSLIGAVETNGTDQNTGSPTWSFTIDADDTNESLRIRVTGAASETVVWRAVAFYRVV